MTIVQRFLSVCALASLTVGCGECIGTPSCQVAPEISVDGQIVDHATGRAVGGTAVVFVRDSGLILEADSITAIANGDGFFALRMGATTDGTVHGHVRVAAPAPFQPYTIPGISLATTRTRGDGTFIGRFVAKPYFRLIGYVRDRKTQAPLEGVTVIWRRNSGGRVSQDSMTFVSDYGGIFAWQPEVVQLGTINATFELRAPGQARAYVLTRDLALFFRESETRLEVLPVGMGLSYYAAAVRRGLGLPLSGATVELTRLSGVATLPQQTTITPNQYGSFDIALEPQAPGSLYVRVRVIPPAPLPAESRTVAMATSDDDVKQFLGTIGYGAAAFFGAELRDSATGTLLPDQTPVRIRRVGGLLLQWPSPPPPEGDPRVVNSRGRIEYGAPTADTGAVTFDVTVQLPTPFAWDTIRGITVPSRYNDTLVDRGTLLVRRRPRP